MTPIRRCNRRLLFMNQMAGTQLEPPVEVNVDQGTNVNNNINIELNRQLFHRLISFKQMLHAVML